MTRVRKGTTPPDPPGPASPAQQSTPAQAINDRRVDPRLSWVVAAAAFSAAIVVVASFFPELRLWGVNHLAFWPRSLRHVAFAVLLLAFLPSVPRIVYRLALGASDRHAAAPRLVGISLAAVLAVASVAMFWHFRAATNLLGDGQLIAQSFEAAEEGHDSVIMRSAKAIVTEEVIAPGTTLLYHAAIKTAARVTKKADQPVRAMRVLNCVLGGVFVFILLGVARSRALGAEPRLWLVVLAAFSCSMLLFFGYIENYTTPYLFAALYVVTAFRALHRRGPLWLPIIPLVLATYSHVHSILLIPSHVYLLIWMRMRSRRGMLLHYWMPVFSAAAVVVIVVCSSVEGMKKFFVPFGIKDNALLAPRHFADVANELLMLLPIAPVVATMGWLGRRAERTGGHDPMREKTATKDPASWFSHPAEWQFVGTILVACGLYLFFFRPEIGMARDWDLFTLATVGLVPLSLLALNRYVRVTGLTTDVSANFAVPALVLVVVTGVAWVGVNSSVDRTIDRFQRILAYDKAHAAYAWENLAILEHDRGNLEAAIHTMETAIANGNNPRHSVRLAVYLEEAGRIDEAIATVEKVLVRRPDFDKARYRLAVFLEKKGDWAKMLDVSRDGIRYHPDMSFYRFLYGESLIRVGRIDEGVEVFKSCRGMNLPEVAKKRVEQVLSAYEAQGK
jgi:tetratricopeptide (TPR) repeat protein